ncbi:helix-turn-helix domain-containing protein [Staphylococcus massiliensis]|uniref:Transcriptional regulator n=1 Tax=Staphylococcus massiliensis S46 TaxID=1229783 RepID=K9ARD2_9STAP|nr:XRE family transcriptional regulator [Staphylococcus massiliensis]EKU48601.1 transcriptional regulator [Staphylococcus massiliensis S46]MCG3400247.1 XRE family transcriptional regulator [Staphylococcus massiliensis]MCG3401877.1 XRE family transcriptional regulator [Staphylococcus massiliensis]MCG3413130.1 XRE family transcriptional regulator [Staphylococcus massiliensis]PNZ98458.1 XRE family transcriptional regulator [Staphylococcus massiliensis CCUG 55927]
MEKINLIIANNIKKIRQKEQMSLDKVSRATGVSKTVLSQIEKGTSNPTISTLWKIANGLRVPLTLLTETEHDQIRCVTKDDIDPIKSPDGSTVIYPYFPYDDREKFEMFVMTIQADSEMVSESHPKGSIESIIVNQGVLELSINDQTYVVQEHEAIRFECDVPHTYKNVGHTDVSLSAVIYYPES